MSNIKTNADIEAVELVEVTLLSDYWDINEKRISANSIIELPFETAEKLVNEGKAKVALLRKK